MIQEFCSLAADLVLSSYQQPLLHAIVFLIEMTLVARLVSRYNAYYGQRPGMFDLCPSPTAAAHETTSCPVAVIALTIGESRMQMNAHNMQFSP